jgi:hypothetical protein
VLTTYFLINNTVDLLFKKKKTTKSAIRFEDGQVSDLTRRCEKVNIYINDTEFSNKRSMFIQNKK